MDEREREREREREKITGKETSMVTRRRKRSGENRERSDLDFHFLAFFFLLAAFLRFNF